MKLQISIVDFFTPLETLKRTLRSLERASAAAIVDGALSEIGLDIVDNSPGGVRRETLTALLGDMSFIAIKPVRVISGHGNVGYGRGHNISVRGSVSDFHLVANPDLEFAPDSLINAAVYSNRNRSVGLLTPQVLDSSGLRERRFFEYPSVFTLFLRGFAPGWVKARFKRRLEHYVCAHEDLSDVVRGLRITTGCFMWFRTATLKVVGGFDERFFLYFEDFDLSLRLSRESEVHYCPAVGVVHFGGNAAKKGRRHIMLFCASAIRFFNTHGWKWL